MIRKRAAIIVPSNRRAAANAALEAAGYGPNNFSVEIIPTSQPNANPPATHYGLSWAMSAGEKRHVQKILVDAGVTPIWDEARSFGAALAANNLKRVVRI